MTGFRLAARRDVITEPPMGAAMMPSEIQMGAVHVAGEHEAPPPSRPAASTGHTVFLRLIVNGQPKVSPTWWAATAEPERL
jgi:hypothetical protein